MHRHADTGEINRRLPGPKPLAYTNASPRHREIVAPHTSDPFAKTSITAAAQNVTMQTVRNHLRADGLTCCRPARKILLSTVLRQNRVRFAKEYRHFDWQNNVVIFTDEKCFKSDKDGRKILWRKKGERYTEKNILPIRTSGRITLGYWGWMSSMGPGELVEVGARNNSHGYLNI